MARRLMSSAGRARFRRRSIAHSGPATAAADGVFLFARPDGTRIAEAGRLDRHATANAQGAQPLAAQNRAHGLVIDAGTSRCGWRGESMDYGLAAERLRGSHRLARPQPW